MDVHLRPTSSLTTFPLISASRLGYGPDQDSMKSSLQSILKYLDRVHDMMDYVHKPEEILEIRTRITQLLQAIVDDKPQTIVPLALDELNAVSPSLTPPSNLEYGPSGFDNTLLEGLPIGKLPQDLVRGEPEFLPEYDTYFDEKALSESSARCEQQPSLPTAQTSQDKVKCILPGCLAAIRKDSLTRHVNEVHWRRIKAVCVDCGKGFARLYMLKNHTCRAKCRKSY